MKIKHCQHCKTTEEPLMIISIVGDGKYRYHMCRKCNTERARKYRHTIRGKKKVYDAVYRSQAKNREQTRARQMVQYHLKCGHLIKPNACSACKQKFPVEAHHSDYSKPLEVIWLCRPCHFDLR